MSSPKKLPDVQAMNNDIISGSPPQSQPHFLIPSPIPTRRTRTYSACERAAKGPVLHGKVKNFCRQRGHGFITPADGTDPLFVHISDIDGEYVPVEGDEVTYKTVHIPPRYEKIQAVHVRITHLNPEEKHEKWDSSVQNPC